MALDYSRICPRCFSTRVQDHVCRKCGYTKGRKNDKISSYALPEFHVLSSRYLLGIVLGAGGFGITYKAYDMYNNMVCAVKEYAPVGISRRGGDQVTMYPMDERRTGYYNHGKKRFLEEAGVLKQLSGIREVVGITDYFLENNTGYFVMEYIDGTTLRKLMQVMGGHLSVNDATLLISKVGKGLANVHSRAGIFHRDISPDNILLNRDGEVKLIDFGSAKYLLGQKSQNLSVVLKPGFAPPEQYSTTGKQGTYTDVYALASTYYYLLTGKMIPEASERYMGQSYMPLKHCCPGISEYVSHQVDRALELNYKNRTQTVEEFVSAIEGMNTQQPNHKEETVIPNIPRNPTLYVKCSVADGLPHAHIEIIQGLNQGQRWVFPSDITLTMGRSVQFSEIILDSNMQISKLHGKLSYDYVRGTLILEDQSVNGIYVNGVRLEKGVRYELNQETQFTIGRKICIIKWGTGDE